MQLYIAQATCSLAVQLVLNELGQSPELIHYDVFDKTTSNNDDFAVVNPLGYVPVLRLDNAQRELVTETIVIISYLADLHPEAGLIPLRGSLERVRMDQLLTFTATEVAQKHIPLMRKLLTEEGTAWTRAKLVAAYTRLDQRLADGRAYLDGDRFTVADAYVWGTLWHERSGADIGHLHNLMAYIARINARPAAAKALKDEADAVARHDEAKARKAARKTLPERLAEFKRNFEAGGPPYNAPAWIHEPMHRATAELVASRAAERALRVGDRAPEFTLPDVDGRPVSSRELLARGPLVLTFYRGVWCPYCNLDLQALQEALPRIEGLGANLVAVSPQTAANTRRTVREAKIGFPILTDRGNEVAAAFGLRFTLPDYLQDLYRNVFKNDLAINNGEPSWTLPMPARYVVGQDGVIAYAEVNPDYSLRPDPEDLQPVLQRLQVEVVAGAA